MEPCTPPRANATCCRRTPSAAENAESSARSSRTIPPSGISEDSVSDCNPAIGTSPLLFALGVKEDAGFDRPDPRTIPSTGTGCSRRWPWRSNANAPSRHPPACSIPRPAARPQLAAGIHHADPRRDLPDLVDRTIQHLRFRPIPKARGRRAYGAGFASRITAVAHAPKLDGLFFLEEGGFLTTRAPSASSIFRRSRPAGRPGAAAKPPASPQARACWTPKGSGSDPCLICPGIPSSSAASSTAP